MIPLWNFFIPKWIWFPALYSDGDILISWILELCALTVYSQEGGHIQFQEGPAVTWSFSVYSVFLLTLTKCGTPIEISLCHFNNFQSPSKGPANFILYETCNDRIPFLSVNAVLVCIVSTVIDFPLLSEVSKQPKNVCSTGKGPLVESLTVTLLWANWGVHREPFLRVRFPTP